MESDQDKMVRYLAMTFMEREGLSADEARARAEARVLWHESEMKIAKKQIRKDRFSPKTKTPKRGPKDIYGFHGAPLQGGAPGLGKRK